MRGTRPIWRVAVALALAAPLLAAGVSAAQTPPAGAAPAPAQPATEEPLGRRTPWGAVTGFIRAAERQDFARAAQYLDTRRQGASAEDLAQQLFVVLDRGLTTDLDLLSRSPDGSQTDGLPATRDRVGIIETPSGGLDVQVERIERGADQAPIWLFSSDTLEAIPAAFDDLSGFALEAYIPGPLLEIRILSQPLYRWLVAPLFLGLAWLLGSLVSRALTALLRPVARRLTAEQDDRVSASLAPPMRLIFVGLAIRALSIFSLSLQARQFWIRVTATILVVGGAWLIIRFSDILSELASRRLVRRRMFGRLAMLGLGRGLFRGTVIVVAALALLYRAGVDLTAILTGLGIGGLGLALAAQKTLENLFGGIMIISDEPMRVGDYCRIDDLTGTIEDIGLRSTRVRTLARTVVAIPNGQLATMNIENFALRDKFWLHHTVGVRYETSPDQMRHLLTTVRGMLHAHPKVEREGARIRFVGFGGSSLDLEIFAYVYAADMADYLAIQEDVLLRVMDLVAESGTSIAFPSRTTYITRDTPLDSEKAREAEREVERWRERGELPFPDFELDRTVTPTGARRDPPDDSMRAAGTHATE